MLIPFGAVPAAQALRTSDAYRAEPRMAAPASCGRLLDQRDLLVVADVPVGPSALNVEIDPLADLHLLVLLADAMSLALLPKLQHGDYLLAADPAAAARLYPQPGGSAAATVP